MLFYLIAKTVYTADANGDSILPDVTMPELPQSDFSVEFAKMFITFIALILLLAGSFWFVRRLIRSRTERGSDERSIHILEKRAISPKSVLYLVEVEGQKILLAESQSEIRRLQNWPLEKE